jgi:tetratricopeptide (TPR) repeat protein
MRAAIGHVCVAALLATTGASLWAIGHLQRRAVAVQERMFTLEYAGPGRERGPLEGAAELAHRLPVIGQISGELAEQRATSQYWLGEYEALAVPADATRAELDPAVLMISAHAAYRRMALDGGDPDAIRRLNRILELYVEVLKRDPRQIDAAFNFEFIARRRNALASLGGARASFQRAAALPPPGRTLHGDRGAAPLGLDKTEFKVIVPQPSDERQEQREAGSGTPRARKG